MNLRYFTMIGSLSALAAGGALLAPASASASEQGVEELTRGPVHEAFAATVTFDPEPGMFVKTSPPTLIEEVPPDQRPEGDNVSWIPGYWGWDEESSDFIWISGVWRNLPPGRQWVPGYWAEAGSQWQWTSGYWADEETEEVTYVSKPPRSIESGPNVEAPSSNHIWVSGTWINREERYAWRPGYWEPGQANWTWIPAHYQWTPRGYIFIEGYWDYNVERRGVVFAPVRFQHEYYNRPDYIYTPLVVIALNVFADHLFLRPSYGHYYYGDYYAPRYQNEGFYASFSYRSGRTGYDPIYAQSRWQHRDDRDWERSRRDNFTYYQSHEDARPPRTWAALQSRPDSGRQAQRDNYQLAEPLQQYATSTKGQKFQPVNAENRTRIMEQNKQVRKFSQERRQLENRPDDKATEGTDKRIQVKRERFQKSPVVAKRADQLSGNDAPPKRHASKEMQPRDTKTAGPDGKGGNNPDEPKKGGQATTENREDNAKSNTGKGKSTEQGRGKNEADPEPKTDPAQRPKGEPGMKENGQDNTRPDRKATEGKGNKSDSTPNRADSEPNPPKKQATPREPEKKQQKVQPEPTRQVEPQRQPQPKPERAVEPERKQQKAQPEPTRQAEPQRQPQPKPERTVQPERKQQKAQPEPTRQVEPQRQPQPKPERTAQPERKQQRAQPEPQRQAEPQRQVAPTKEPAPSKKKPDKEEDPESSKKNR